MSELTLRAADDCRFDFLTLGEVMLRFDPGEGRVRTARSFNVSEGGGEYNLGRALQRCFRQRTALVTAIGDTEIGRLLENLLLQGGMNLDHVVWKSGDEVGRTHRTPLNFTERGFGVRAPKGVYDRANSATASLEPGDVDWEHIFGELGVRVFHTGGIFAGLSKTTLAVAQEAMRAAQRHGTIVSYDINYRPSLWAKRGGVEAAQRTTDQLLEEVDILLGVESNELESMASAHPGLSVVAGTRRIVHSASRHDWGGAIWSRRQGRIEGRRLTDLAVLDRVGSGDAFGAGLLFGLLDGRPITEAVELAVAHGALVMTEPGDISSADMAEVERLAAGGDAVIQR